MSGLGTDYGCLRYRQDNRVAVCVDPRCARCMQARGREPLPDTEYAWLGDLAGFSMQVGRDGSLWLEHRCGWSKDVEAPDNFLGNIVAAAIQERQGHVCLGKGEGDHRE